MLSLKWGDLLSMLFPGVVGLYALGYWSPTLKIRLMNLHDVSITEGVALLIAAGLLGEFLGVLTRVSWEKILQRLCQNPEVLHNLTPDNLVLYERGVQSSYKYVTFYANLAWATIFLLISYWCKAVKPASICSLLSLILVVTIPLLFYASYVQWTYFVNYQNKVFGGNHNAGQ